MVAKRVSSHSSKNSEYKNHQMKIVGRYVKGGIFIFLGGVMITAWASVTTLNCTRLPSAQIDCELTATSLWNTNQVKITQLQDAELKFGRRRNQRVHLLSENGKRTPLTDYYIIGPQPRRHQEKIRAFVANPTAMRLSLKQDQRWLFYAVGGWFIVAGGMIVADFQ